MSPYLAQADFLKRFMPSFKDHSTLSASHEHKYLYTYIGTVAVLRCVLRAVGSVKLSGEVHKHDSVQHRHILVHSTYALLKPCAYMDMYPMHNSHACVLWWCQVLPVYGSSR